MNILKKLFDKKQSPSLSNSNLDVETVRRYIRGIRTISRLAYVGPAGPQVLLSDGDVPLDTVAYPVLIPTESIAGIEELVSVDFRYFVIQGEKIGLESGTMLFTLDYDTRPTRTALSFLFTFAQHAKWLIALVALGRLGVNDGPNGLPSRALLLEFDAPLTPVEDWLYSYATQIEQS